MSKVWVTRDRPKKGFLQSQISIWKTKPELNTYAYVSRKETPAMVSMWTFEYLFGFTPDKGTCEQYELTLTEIE